MERNENGWTVNGQPGDNEKVEKYLWALSRYYGDALTDPADTLNAVLIYSMRVVDSSRKDPIILGVFNAGGRLIARSTLAPSWLVMPFDPKSFPGYSAPCRIPAYGTTARSINRFCGPFR